MIKQIIFKNTKDFSSKPIIVDFSKGVNVIIGPKGGGKSTLFDLIAGLKNNCIYDNVIKALESYNLKFEKAIMFSNEEILFSQLTKKNQKDKENDYKNRYDVIYQDDQIKKDLTNLNDIDKNKFLYLESQVNNSQNITKLVNKIRQMWNSMNQINEYFNEVIVDINWTNTFKMNEFINNDQLSLITNLDYKPTNLILQIDNEINHYNNVLQAIDEFNTKLTKFNLLDKNVIHQDDVFNKSINEQINDILKRNSNLSKLISTKKELFNNIKNITSIFRDSYKKVIENIKSENYLSGGLKNYDTKAKNHFKNLAHDIYTCINNFEKLSTNELEISIENNENQNGSLIYKIDENIKLNDEVRFEILKIVFHSPGNTKDDIGKWLKSLTEKGIKEFNEDKLKKGICRELKEYVKLYINLNNELKEYSTLSLGQKSIYGLKYKFNKSIKNDIYLDQPEDNLDNNTIAEEILPMINSKKGNQVFIITHNANIGILTNPEQIIVADLNNLEKPYKISNLLEVINNESAHYLEGGKEYLKQRYEKIINK